jgi:hypothetical protein
VNKLNPEIKSDKTPVFFVCVYFSNRIIFVCVKFGCIRNTGTHHSKYFLVEYEAGMRVIIHTANLIFCDCHNKSQGIWVQDFPRKVSLQTLTHSSSPHHTRSSWLDLIPFKVSVLITGELR